MRVKLLDLSRQHEPIRDEMLSVFADVVDSQRFIGGERLERFEHRMAERVGVAHAIGVSSGTDALLMALMALGTGPGDEVITTAFSFVSPVECILRLGATPVFVDIDPRTFNLDPRGLDDAITEKTRAILPVHLFGQMTDMDGVRTSAARHELAIVEDAAQSLGARDGRISAGAEGVGCLSFFPSKNLGALGDGGMALTDDGEISDELRKIRHHGAAPKYVHRRLGGNFRLDTLQAALLDLKLDHLDAWTQMRRENAAFYDEAFRDREPIITPVELPAHHHVYNQYCIRVRQRDRIRKALAECGIETGVYYPLPLHRQPICSHLGISPGAFPEANRAAEEVLALPVYPGLTRDELEYVADHVRRLV